MGPALWSIAKDKCTQAELSSPFAVYRGKFILSCFSLAMKNASLFLILTVWFFTVATTSPLAAQGPLAPPAPAGSTTPEIGPLAPTDTLGAPLATMKTLHQVEPRIDLTSVSGSSDYEHILSEPGSYYLTANLEVTRQHGILISAPNVSLDLSGFQISFAGESAAQNWGINVTGEGRGVHIHNGSITGFTTGLRADRTVGDDDQEPDGGIIQNIRVISCSDNGITGGHGWTIQNCIVTLSGGGIAAGAGSIISYCTAEENTGTGIIASDGTLVSHSTVVNNRTRVAVVLGENSTMLDSIVVNNVSEVSGSEGISALENATIKRCTVSFNTSTVEEEGDILDQVNGVGIDMSLSGVIENCTLVGNGADAIRINSECIVRGNTLIENRGNAITIIGDRNIVRGNEHIDSGVIGIIVDGDRNVILENIGTFSTYASGGNAGTNNVFPIVNGSAIVTASPYANVTN